MKRVGLMDNFILKCYEGLHTQSREHVTEDVLGALDIWESKMATCYGRCTWGPGYMGIQNGDGQMRTVFHGSLEEIISPLVHIGRENLDFGKGFYVTDILHQAEVWAGIKSRYFMDAKAVVNEYLFDFDNAIKDFKYKKFERYDGEWLHFIVDSRDGKKV